MAENKSDQGAKEKIKEGMSETSGLFSSVTWAGHK